VSIYRISIPFSEKAFSKNSRHHQASRTYALVQITQCPAEFALGIV